jgi:hypothetical protein
MRPVIRRRAAVVAAVLICASSLHWTPSALAAPGDGLPINPQGWFGTFSEDSDPGSPNHYRITWKFHGPDLPVTVDFTYHFERQFLEQQIGLCLVTEISDASGIDVAANPLVYPLLVSNGTTADPPPATGGDYFVQATLNVLFTITVTETAEPALPGSICSGGIGERGSGISADSPNIAGTPAPPFTAEPGWGALTGAWQATGGTETLTWDLTKAPDCDGDGIPNFSDLDDDNDGLLDTIETGGSNPTDPCNPDTDGDGIPDGVEDANHNGAWDRGAETDPTKLDTDGDIIPDGVEDANHNGVKDPGETDPRLVDTDGDGPWDGDEVLGTNLSGLNPNGVISDPLDPNSPTPGGVDPDNDGVPASSDNCPNLPNQDQANHWGGPAGDVCDDTDSDGLTDAQEDANHNGVWDFIADETDPTNADTDMDFLNDGAEVSPLFVTDPTNTDSDADGLSDFEETQYGTRPLTKDSDGDTVPDGVEVRVGTSPTNRRDFPRTYASKAPTSAVDVQRMPVLFIHGIANPILSLGLAGEAGDAAHDCPNYWGNFINEFRTVGGWQAPLLTIGYYAKNTGCDVNLGGPIDPEPPASNADDDDHLASGGLSWNTNIEHVAQHFAWYVWRNWSSQGIPVNIVAHSMGGLITRYAMDQVAVSKGRSAAWPPYLYVHAVVTLGTPHNGGQTLADFCATGVGGFDQCDELQGTPQSPFIKTMTSLDNDVPPQGKNGTDWTVVAGSHDQAVPDSFGNESGLGLNAKHKIMYDDPLIPPKCSFGPIDFTIFHSLVRPICEHDHDGLHTVVGSQTFEAELQGSNGKWLGWWESAPSPGRLTWIALLSDQL